MKVFFIILVAAAAGCTAKIDGKTLSTVSESCSEKGGVAKLITESVMNNWATVTCKDGAEYTVVSGRIQNQTKD